MEMSQHLRLHARNASFADTVQEARRFAAAVEHKPRRKQVRISTPAAHDTVNVLQTKDQALVLKRMDRLEGLIKSLQVARSPKTNPPPSPKTYDISGSESPQQSQASY